MLSRLLRSSNPPLVTYLILQEEAAEKYLGVPRETQVSLLLKPLFGIKILSRLSRTDFSPKPRVNSVLVEFEKRDSPLILRSGYKAYCDFIVYATTQWKPTIGACLGKVLTKEQIRRLSNNLGFSIKSAPLGVSFEQWVGLFNYYDRFVDDSKKILVRGSYLHQQEIQKKLKKVYRTR